MLLTVSTGAIFADDAIMYLDELATRPNDEIQNKTKQIPSDYADNPQIAVLQCNRQYGYTETT